MSSFYLFYKTQNGFDKTFFLFWILTNDIVYILSTKPNRGWLCSKYNLFSWCNYLCKIKILFFQQNLIEAGFAPNRVYFLDMPADSIIERLSYRMLDPITGER